MAICSQLEILCQKEVVMNPGKHAEEGNISSSLEAKGSLLLDKLKDLTPYLPQPNVSILEYLKQMGFDNLYPRATNFIANPKTPNISVGSPENNGYFELLEKIDNLVSLASQIRTDITYRTNLKYIPHQLVLLHQFLTVFNANDSMGQLKKNLEGNFEAIKAGFTPKGPDEPEITDDHANWLLQVTQLIIDEALALPADMTSRLLPTATAIANMN